MWKARVSCAHRDASGIKCLRQNTRRQDHLRRRRSQQFIAWPLGGNITDCSVDLVRIRRLFRPPLHPASNSCEINRRVNVNLTTRVDALAFDGARGASGSISTRCTSLKTRISHARSRSLQFPAPSTQSRPRWLGSDATSRRSIASRWDRYIDHCPRVLSFRDDCGTGAELGISTRLILADSA